MLELTETARQLIIEADEATLTQYLDNRAAEVVQEIGRPSYDHRFLQIHSLDPLAPSYAMNVLKLLPETSYYRGIAHTESFAKQQRRDSFTRFLSTGAQIYGQQNGYVTIPLGVAHSWANAFYYSKAGAAANTPDAAFNTALGMSPEYAQAYGASARNAFNSLYRRGLVSESSPYTAIVVGDPQDLVLKSVIESLKEVPRNLTRFITIDLALHNNGPVADVEVERMVANVINMDKILDKLGPTAGTIFLEEVLDDLPVTFYDTCARELYLKLSKREKTAKLLRVDYNERSLDTLLFINWIHTFPHYQDIFDRLQAAFGPNEIVPLNISILKLMQDIGQADFTGHIVAGDYSGMFQGNTSPLGGAVRVYSREEKRPSPESRFDVTKIVKGRRNITTDVDPLLLAISGRAFGLNLVSYENMAGFIAAHIQDWNVGDPVDLLLEARNALDLRHPDPKKIGDFLLSVEKAENLYTSNRFVCTLATADLPAI